MVAEYKAPGYSKPLPLCTCGERILLYDEFYDEFIALGYTAAQALNAMQFTKPCCRAAFMSQTAYTAPVVDPSEVRVAPRLRTILMRGTVADNAELVRLPGVTVPTKRARKVAPPVDAGALNILQLTPGISGSTYVAPPTIERKEVATPGTSGSTYVAPPTIERKEVATPIPTEPEPAVAVPLELKLSTMDPSTFKRVDVGAGYTVGVLPYISYRAR